MRFALSVAALAGAAMAAPGAGYSYPENVPDNVVVEVTTVVKTVYVSEGFEVPTPTPAPVYPTQEEQKPEYTTTVEYEAPAPPAPTTPVYEETKPTYEETKPEPTPTPAPAPAPSNSGYMGVVDTWRSNLGMAALTHDSLLESNALKTVQASNGKMEHMLLDGTSAQVLAPGSADDFEHVFVGGWLCEISTLPGLNGVCAQQSNGWEYMGQTGHAEILTNPDYKKIGCALHAGIWCCDLS